MTQSSPILQSVSVRAVCPNGKVWSYRTRAPVGNLKTDGFTPRQSRASASHSRSVATYPPGNGNWDRTIERTNSLVALVRSLFTRWGHIGITKFLRAIQAPGSLLRVAFVNDCRQPANRIGSTFKLSPVLSSSVLHARNMQQKDARSHEQCTREYE